MEHYIMAKNANAVAVQSEANSGLVINAKASQGIKKISKGISLSAKLTNAKNEAECAPQLIMEGLCLITQNGILPSVALHEITGIKGMAEAIGKMWKSDKSCFEKVCQGLEANIQLEIRGVKQSIRELMVAKVRKDKATGQEVITWPSMQGIAGKIREAETAARLLSEDKAIADAAKKEAAKKKADADVKAASNAIKQFGSISNSVKALCHAVKTAEDVAKLDKEKAAVLAYVAGLSPKAITALMVEYKIK